MFSPTGDGAESECSTRVGCESECSLQVFPSGQSDCSSSQYAASESGSPRNRYRSRNGSGESFQPRSQGRGPTAESAVIFFDWDDTLFPTRHILAKPTLGAPAGPGGAIRVHARLVEETLRAARNEARVAIVTLSARPWVTESSEQYLPGINMPALLRELEIPVFYAEEHIGVPGAKASDLRLETASDLTTLKANAMAQCLNEWYSTEVLTRSCGLNVLSIGDSEHEATALKEIMEEWGQSPLFPDARFCKTVKLMDGPTLHQLSSELLRLPPWFRRMTLLRGDFDLSIDSPEEFESKARGAVTFK